MKRPEVAALDERLAALEAGVDAFAEQLDEVQETDQRTARKHLDLRP